MSTRPILIHPDPRLKKVAAEVTAFDADLQALAADMLDTMYDAPGIGLAGPQIGAMQRIFVMDCAAKEAEPEPLVLINPQIVAASDDLSEYEEGCLSIPDIYETITRPAAVQMRWQDLDGQVQEAEFGGLEATCVQHELDHLNGKLFIDYLSALKRRMITSKMQKLKKERLRA
ncbi:peptide deformylase [Oceanomicrobium pacificus]|uniref:Peptide deformylase n=1 Tax=Oceanomicrobium pacificus TaxID=2692916 RepID=A0A6B0TRJ1_9RHOB|nr:peptide deformylase [Oceanomicrobium pacificus]MXU63974.1 peptide deformylase [Oceanomicrobium pacificus]